MRLKSVSFKIAILFLVFTAVFTLFRSSMSGIFSLFYAKNGIPDANISSIKSFQNIGIMFGLLLAGYLADKIGRLKVLALSSSVIPTSFFILLLFRNFFFFSTAELLYSIGLALNSGTLLAYVTDLQEQTNGDASNYFEFNHIKIGGNIGTWLFGIKDTAQIWFAMLGLVLYPALIWFMISILSFSDNRASNKKQVECSAKNIVSFLGKETSGYYCC